MTEDDTFNILRSVCSIESKHGGYYCFNLKHKIDGVIIGSIKTHGKINEIIFGKQINEQLVTDWLDQLIFEKMFYDYSKMCDIYAGHILYTHPEPGGYWKWKDKSINT
jgi:hypothetical protein